MKQLYGFCGTISGICYLLFWCGLCQLCRYGGVHQRLPFVAVIFAGFLISFLIRLVLKQKLRKNFDWKPAKTAKRLTIVFFLAVTVLCGSRIVYFAIPYNGALSWKLDELRRKRRVTLSHDNFFEYGAEGILSDLDSALSLPEELYVATSFSVTFDESGTIQTIETFLYGKNEKGEEKTYLVSYDRAKDNKMTVWLDGEATADYDEDTLLSPMLTILNAANVQEQVAEWEAGTYGILYYGRRSFSQWAGLVQVFEDDEYPDYLNFERLLSAGGEIAGYEVSLYMPEQETLTPVRYILNPEYISQETISAEQEAEGIAEARDTSGWSVDETDGTMYYFMTDSVGWRLVVTDAAAGSRFYELSKTTDGGTSWQSVNADPFAGNIGVAEGLIFYDETFGIAGLGSGSQSYSRLFVTYDGGASFTQMEFPTEGVTELPSLSMELGYSVEDYAYYEMPEKTDDILTVCAKTGMSETEGILFESTDNGATWSYAGIRTAE